MYYYIKGTLAAKGENYIVVDVSGVGYMIYTSLNGIEKSGPIGNQITVYTYLNVREDAMDIYGFVTEEEKKMFMLLISVSGVGPKAGLAILSVAPPAKLATAIITGDTKTITKAAGVGPKVAQRVILELKDKIDSSSLGIEAEDLSVSDEVITDNRAEAMSALVVLGYSPNDARNVLSKLDASLSTEDLIKQALVKLM
jgi:Holliday junction DNA helicase RuvA